MSLKDEFNYSKMNAGLSSLLADVDDKADPNIPLFEAFVLVKDKGSRLPTIVGAEISSTKGVIRTARNITLNGLKTLLDNDEVVLVSAARTLRPL